MTDTKFIFEKVNGERSEVITSAPGGSAMQLATNHGIPEIIGECGGSLSCATCHAYIDEEWVDRLPPPSEDELVMLEGVLNRKDNSRLTCQISLTSSLDGLIIHLPEAQY